MMNGDSDAFDDLRKNEVTMQEKPCPKLHELLEMLQRPT